VNPAPPVHRRSLLARLITLLTGLGAALLLTLLLAANIGAQPVPLGVIADSVRRFFSGGPAGPQSYLATIFWDLRLPRVALGAIVGMALSVAGGALQGLLMNPLADPYLVGVSAGAALGASAAILFHAGNLAGGAAKCLVAFVAGAGTMAIVLWLSRSRRVIQRDAFILAGVVVGSFMWALVTMVMSLAGGDLQTIVHWLMGNLSAEVNWSVVGVAAALVAIGCLALYSYARDLNLLALGEEQAQQLGVETEGVKIRVILYSALVTAAAVSVSGIIGFVGLVVPHVARKLVGPDHRLLLPAAGLLGAAFLVWADTLARGIGESFPVGVLTSLLGAPFFFYLLKRRPRPV
jgi:iron complex transport system permease protein